MTGFSSWSSYCTAEESILGHYTAKLEKKDKLTTDLLKSDPNELTKIKVSFR